MSRNPTTAEIGELRKLTAEQSARIDHLTGEVLAASILSQMMLQSVSEPSVALEIIERTQKVLQTMRESGGLTPGVERYAQARLDAWRSQIPSGH